MAILTSPGTAGFGEFSVDTVTGEVSYDPQGNGGGWADGTTETRAKVLVRDAAGALGLGAISVDVTKAAGPAGYVTDGMTVTNTWSTVGAIAGHVANKTQMSGRIDISARSSGQGGILIEEGSTSYGYIMAIVSDVLYFQIGVGTSWASGTDRWHMSAAMPTGARVVEWSCNCTNGKGALYIDGSLVDSETISAPPIRLSGTNNGALGAVYSSCIVNPFGYATTGDGLFTGTLVQATFYNNQLTGDVS